MNVDNEITRLVNSRNTIRTKMVDMGIASNTDKLDELSTKLNAISVKEASTEISVDPGDTVNIDAGYYKGGTITASDAPVLSVNTKTGDVVLDAEDVGAISKDSVEDAIDVGVEVAEDFNVVEQITVDSTDADVPTAKTTWKFLNGISPLVGTALIKYGDEEKVSGYRDIPWLLTSGNQFIDTGISGDETAEYMLEFYPLFEYVHDWEQYFAGEKDQYGYGDVAPKVYRLGKAYSSKPNRVVSQSTSFIELGSSDNAMHTVTFFDNKISWDGVLIRDFGTPKHWGSLTWYYGNAHGEPNLGSVARLGRLQMYSDGSLVRYFVPKVRVSDGKPGFFDLVSGTFFTNAGTDEFITPTMQERLQEIIDRANDVTFAFSSSVTDVVKDLIAGYGKIVYKKFNVGFDSVGKIYTEAQDIPVTGSVSINAPAGTERFSQMWETPEYESDEIPFELQGTVFTNVGFVGVQSNSTDDGNISIDVQINNAGSVVSMYPYSGVDGWRTDGDRGIFSKNSYEDDSGTTINSLLIKGIHNTGTCVSGDTMILMGDGSEKPINTIVVGDIVSAFNPNTMEIEGVPVTAVGSPVSEGCFETYEFSDGSYVKVMGKHRFWRKETNSMDYIQNFEIGDHTVNKSGNFVELISKVVSDIKTKQNVYFIHNKYHNYFCNGVMSGNRATKTMNFLN